MRAHKFIFFFLDSCVFLSFNCTIKWTIVNTITTEKKGRNAIEISQRRNIRKVEEKEKENQKRIKSFFVFFFFPFSLHSGFFVFFEFFVLVCWAMGFDEDVNETVDFLLGEDGVDSINDNNFTYDDGDDVIVDPNALLLDHNNNNHNNNDNIPLIIVAFKDKHGNLCLPKGYLEELEGYVSEEEHEKMMTDIQQTHSSYVNFWKELKLLVFMVVVLLLPLFSMGGVLVLVISEMVACSGDNTYKDDDSTGLIECEGDWTLLCFIGSLFTFMMFMLEVFLCSLIKRNVSLPDQLELKTDEDRKRKVTEVVEKMSDEQTFGNRVQYRINYIRDPYRVLIYLKK